jgi:hypothetical protein
MHLSEDREPHVFFPWFLPQGRQEAIPKRCPHLECMVLEILVCVFIYMTGNWNII